MPAGNPFYKALYDDLILLLMGLRAHVLGARGRRAPGDFVINKLDTSKGGFVSRDCVISAGARGLRQGCNPPQPQFHQSVNAPMSRMLQCWMTFPFCRDPLQRPRSCCHFLPPD